MSAGKCNLGLLAALAGCIVLSGAGSALAQANVKVGLLKCLVAGGSGFIIGSSKDLECKYEAVDGGKETYRGEISKFGLDVGTTEKSVLFWTVLAPSVNLKPRALAGGYGGVSAGASVGYGANANALIGGFNGAVVLQPLSVDVEQGVNLAVGIAAMQLR